MARGGGGDDLTTIIVLGAAAYAAYKSGLFCGLWQGAPCPSSSGGGTPPPGGCPAGQEPCSGQCVPVGTCQGSGWTVTNITIYFLGQQVISNGSSIDALITFEYTGPGGNVAFGFQTSAFGDPQNYSGCTQTYQNSALFPLPAATSPQVVSLYTSGLRWQGCAWCGSGAVPIDVTPFVIAGGKTFTGPTYSNGVLTC
jgi:hypothetical protein